MIEVTGLLLVAMFLWVVTAIFTLASLNSTDGDTIKIWGVVAVLFGFIAFILTLIGANVITVI